MSSPVSNSAPWAAVYVKHRHEKNVAGILNSRSITSFLPLYSQHCPSGKVFDLPLFPGYVFCRFDKQNLLTVRSTPGVFTIVGNDRKPAVIPEFEIERIRQVIDSKQTIQPWPYTSIGDEVCIKSGPLRGLSGIVMDNTHDHWLVLSVHLLQRSLAVKIERSQFV